MGNTSNSLSHPESPSDMLTPNTEISPNLENVDSHSSLPSPGVEAI